jgi:hypothetical protein
MINLLGDVLKQFAKDPIKITLFLSLCAIGYLYIDNKTVYTKQIEKQELRISLLENDMKILQEKLIESLKK